MPDAMVYVLYLLGLLGIAVLILKLNDLISSLIWRLRNPPAKLASQRLEYEKRLHSPDWTFYEQHLQRSAPNALRAVYLSEELLSRPHYFQDCYLAFSPIDTTALAEAWVLPNVVPFAESEGDPIYLKPGVHSENEVFITYHDGGDTELLATSVETFIAGLRDAA